MLKTIEHYFPNLTELQRKQLEELFPLYKDWNEKINVISRKDIDNLYEHHVLHSLAIAKLIQFKNGAEVLDLGTGGGFPGIPLAIIFPNVQFTLIDGTKKKLKVVQDVADQLDLQNVKVIHRRAEELKQRFDFVVSRAVAKIDKLLFWSERLIKTKHQHGLPNGLIALKGGNIRAEVKELPRGSYSEITPLASLFSELYFEEKYLVYVQGS